MTILVQTSSAPEIPGAATNPPPEFRSKRCAHCDLPETADHDDLLHLQAFLADNIGSAVVISATQVRRADTLLLQLLLAARRDWEQRKMSFSVVDLPEAVAVVLPVLGLLPDTIGLKDIQ